MVSVYESKNHVLLLLLLLRMNGQLNFFVLQRNEFWQLHAPEIPLLLREKIRIRYSTSFLSSLIVVALIWGGLSHETQI